jgi:hypothetical protein
MALVPPPTNDNWMLPSGWASEKFWGSRGCGGSEPPSLYDCLTKTHQDHLYMLWYNKNIVYKAETTGPFRRTGPGALALPAPLSRRLDSGGWLCHWPTRPHNDCSDRSWFSLYVRILIDNSPSENYLKYVLVRVRVQSLTCGCVIGSRAQSS